MLLGIGVAVSFPAIMSLPAEAGVVITPKMMTVMSLWASAGEFLGPWITSRAFAASPSWFGILLGAWQAASLVVVVVGWAIVKCAANVPSSRST